MSQEKIDTSNSIQGKIESCQQARQYEGSLSGFWQEFLKSCVQLVDADFGVTTIHRQEATSWNTVCLFPVKAKESIRSLSLVHYLSDLSAKAENAGHAHLTVETGQGSLALLAVHLALPPHEPSSVALFGIKGLEPERFDEVVILLQLMADTPLNYLVSAGLQQARIDVVRFSQAMDVAIQMNLQQRYVGAAMTLCNEIASRYGCDRVSLGWIDGGYARIQAISHIEKFEKKMAVVLSLEAVMEESISQDEEILLPPLPESKNITRDHELFAKENSIDYLVTFPIRLDDELVGALTCERSSSIMFSEVEIQSIGLIAEQAARRLSDLRENDRWFGARLAFDFRKWCSGLLGVDHTFAKVATIIVSALFCILIFGKMEFRVEAPFIIKSDDVAYLPASFDGYIDQVHVDIGDVVDKNTMLLELDTRELLLEESNANANKVRYERETKKARSTQARSEMKISQALTAQAVAQLKIVRYHLANAQIVAPFSGVVVEGDLQEMLGAPVRKGDVLYKLAKLDKMYVELDVDERDVHYIKTGADGEIAFVSQPKFKYPLLLTRINPVAVTKDEGNNFICRGEFAGSVADWWRPGMSGIAKVNVGQKSIGWIITRRTIDFLRLFLWW